jgi:phosphopantetheine adenylyltransferase
MHFNQIFESLINKFKPTNGETVAIYPGGFKPPHKGHFSSLNYLLEEADKGIVFIGKSLRDGITAEQSKKIWDIYKKYIQKPVDIYIAEKSPIASTVGYADENKNKNIIVGSGPQDEGHFKYFQTNIDKYPLVKIINIPSMHDRISGTQIRNLILQKNQNSLDYFLPEQISQQDKKSIAAILNI